ncbi:MAG: hypothetical protein NVV82_22190 [Sporocytophaga sp.]|nr:hypothetical protein [Sporocytophaga sp.]
MNSTDLVLVAEFLSKSEANEMLSKLKKNGIQGIIKDTGYSNYQRIKLGSSILSSYNVYVVRTNLEKAYPIIESELRKLEFKRQNNKMICSNCKADKSSIYIKEKKYLGKGSFHWYHYSCM